jgi:hypothetical protein
MKNSKFTLLWLKKVPVITFIYKGCGCCRKSWARLKSDGVSCCVIYKVVDNLVWSRYGGNFVKLLVE